MKIFQQANENKKALKSDKFLPTNDVALNIFILGRKKQGKSNLVANIIDMLSSKYTRLNYFQPTYSQDTTKIESQKYFEGKGYLINNHYSIYDEETGANIIDQLHQEMEYMNLKKYETDSDSDSDSEINPNDTKKIISSLLNENKENGKREKKKKKKPYFPEKHYTYAHFINVYDDLPQDQLQKLFQTVRTNRHYKLANIISHHDLKNGLNKKIRNNIDVLIIFGGQPDDRIESIFEEFAPCKNMDKFKKAYAHATKQKYGFLTFDIQNNRVYNKFDQEYQL